MPAQAPSIPSADYGDVSVTPDVRVVADRVMATNDHETKAFAVVDKRAARVYVFSAVGRLIGASPVLIGLAPGDDSEPGIGNKPIAAIRPDERTTPAGRFATIPGHNSDGHPVVWIDYDAAVSMHSVVTGVPSERRLQRLAAADAAQHRISYGCINLPTAFFTDVAAPALHTRGSMVYVLPDTRSLPEVFPTLGLHAASDLRAAKAS